MVDRIIIKFCELLDGFCDWLFAWQKEKYCQCNVNTGSGNRCKRCKCLRKKHG